MTESDELPPPKPEEAEIAELMLEAPVSWRERSEEVLAEVARLDRALYRTIAATKTPILDTPLRRLSNLANNSLLWLGVSGLLALGGRRGRRAAVAGLTSVVATSGIVNLGLKQLYARQRPDRPGAGVVAGRHTRMPSSSSFPSGHSASGFAFATAVGREIPLLALPLRLLAAAVAYSRVHSGVHYPGDAVVGSLAGSAVGLAVGATLQPLNHSRAD